MKVHQFRNKSSRKSISGLTLVEVTVVISILLGLLGLVAFPGVRAYNNGTNRAFCIQNIQAMQKTAHAYANMYQYDAGETVPGLIGTLIGVDGFFPKTPECPGGGSYSFLPIIPGEGQQFMSCTIADHTLEGYPP